jgi:phosphoribosyl 1,2-cyclic phosphate phosphodiesterase
MLGVSYPPEYLANPKNHRTRASLLLQGPSGNVQIDCPPEMRLQLTGANVTSLEAVIVTHAHADHIMGMDDLRSICMLEHRAMPIYTLPIHQEDIRRVFPYAFRQPPAGVAYPKFELFDVADKMLLGGMEIRTFLVLHGKVPVVGLRVNDFAYITDVSEIPPDAEAQLKNLDIFVVDAVRRRPHPNHFHLEKAIEVGRHIGARRTIFTHLGDDYDHDRSNAELPSGFELAFDGMTLEI